MPSGHWVKIRKVPSNEMVQRCVPNVAGQNYSAAQLCDPNSQALPVAADFNIPYPPSKTPGVLVVPVANTVTKKLPGKEVVPVVPVWQKPGKTELGEKFTGTMDYGALRKIALAAGVPALVYDRALANFRDMQIKKLTQRGCFLGSDLTGSTGKTWMMCFNPKPHVELMETSMGGGEGKDCVGDFKNRSGCPRFWSNKPGSCLSTGGNLMTGKGRFYNSDGTGRYFIPLVGTDAGVNTNTFERQIGIHVAADTDGLSTKGKGDPRSLSRGNYVLPFETPLARMTDMSSDAAGGALALYSYPSKADLVEFMKPGGQPPYWDEACRKEVSYAAWIDASGNQNLTTILENSQKDFTHFMLTEPEAQDVPQEQ